MEDRRRFARELARPSGRLIGRHRADLHRRDLPLLPALRQERRYRQELLKIEVLFYDTKGNLVNAKPYDYTTTSTAWQPTGTVKISVFTPKTTVAAAPVAFRFTPQGPTAHYQIDDVYVDPWSRG